MIIKMRISPINMLERIVSLSSEGEKDSGDNKTSAKSKEDSATISAGAKSTLSVINADRNAIDSSNYGRLNLSPQGEVLLMQMGKEALLSASSGAEDLTETIREIAQYYDELHIVIAEKAQSYENKYEMFWRDAFENVVNSIMQQSAGQLSESIMGPVSGATTADDINPFLVSAQKIAAILSAAFLTEYEVNRFDVAWEATINRLGNMPETTSLFAISYKDFQGLNKLLEQGAVAADVAAELLNSNALSDYMKDIVGKRFN